jgi:hypothetical protein
MPESVTDRDADVWESLLAVADLAGGHWPRTGRIAAVTLVTASRSRKPSVGVLLLKDIRAVFSQSGRDRMPTIDILSALTKVDDSPWGAIRRGESLEARGLASRLSKYGIGSKPLRIGDEVIKGYARAQFQDAWSRYLDDDTAPPEGDTAVTAVTAVTDLFNEPAFATDATDVTNFPEPKADNTPRRPGCVCTDQPRACSYCEMAATKDTTTKVARLQRFSRAQRVKH